MVANSRTASNQCFCAWRGIFCCSGNDILAALQRECMPTSLNSLHWWEAHADLCHNGSQISCNVGYGPWQRQSCCVSSLETGADLGGAWWG